MKRFNQSTSYKDRCVFHENICIQFRKIDKDEFRLWYDISSSILQNNRLCKQFLINTCHVLNGMYSYNVQAEICFSFLLSKNQSTTRAWIFFSNDDLCIKISWTECSDWFDQLNDLQNSPDWKKNDSITIFFQSRFYSYLVDFDSLVWMLFNCMNFRKRKHENCSWLKWPYNQRGSARGLEKSNRNQNKSKTFRLNETLDVFLIQSKLDFPHNF